MIGVESAIFSFKFAPQQFQPIPTSQGKKTAAQINIFCILWFNLISLFMDNP